MPDSRYARRHDGEKAEITTSGFALLVMTIKGKSPGFAKANFKDDIFQNNDGKGKEKGSYFSISRK